MEFFYSSLSSFFSLFFADMFNHHSMYYYNQKQAPQPDLFYPYPALQHNHKL